MMAIERDRTKDNPDSVRRKRQSERIVKILQVHKATGGDTSQSVDSVKRIAEKLGVSERTVWRYITTLKTLYEVLGTSLLDCRTAYDGTPLA